VVSYLEQILPQAAVVKLTAAEQQPIVIMATTEAHCLGDLLIDITPASCRRRFAR